MSDMYNDQIIDEPRGTQNSSIQRSGVNLFKRVRQLEATVKQLHEKIKSLNEENQLLRDINIQNQLDNFKMKQQLQKLETSNLEEDTQYEMENEQFDDSFDYIEEAQITYVDVDDKIQDSSNIKRSYSEAFDESEIIEHEEIPKEELREEYLIDDGAVTEDDSNYYPSEDNKDSSRYLEYQIPFVSPKDAYTEISRLAQKRGASEKFSQIPKGRVGDSTFINKCLELLYDRMTLANSSTRGQKFQGKFDVAPKPALDPKKLNVCRQAFLSRLQQEGLSSRDDRFKLFHGHVNSKIQNTRKCVKKQKTPIRGFH